VTNVEIAITERSRRYGYIIWPKKMDGEAKALLKEQQSVRVSFDGEDLGEKRVDWKHRRISVGPRKTRDLPPLKTTFEITSSGTDRIAVRVR
jgi:hypothetical protein